MNTSPVIPVPRPAPDDVPSVRPRVWLAGLPAVPDAPMVRDDQARVWSLESGVYHSPDQRHHLSPAELHARTDLVEVTR